MSDAAIVALSTGAMSAVIAFLAVAIGFQQWRTAQNRLKLDLFDRRFAVYDAARKLLGSIASTGKADDQVVYRFMSDTREAKWLLNEDIAKYFEKGLRNEAFRLATLSSELQGMPVGDERTQNIREQSALKTWFFGQYDVLDAKFAPFLSLQH